MTLRELLETVQQDAEVQGVLDLPVYLDEIDTENDYRSPTPVGGFRLAHHTQSAIDQMQQKPVRNAVYLPIAGVILALET